MSCRVEIVINSEKRYLQKLFPISWTAFISSAYVFEDKFRARDTLNSRYMSIMESLNYNDSILRTIKFVTVENCIITNEEYYLGGS